MRVLICDDNPDVTDTLAVLLNIERHEIKVCNDGQSCIQTAMTWLPNVAFVDIGMPDVNGFDVARAIRRVPFGDQVLLVAYTGWSTADDVAAAKKAGFDVHISKTEEPKKLISVLDRLGGRSDPN